MIAWLKIQFELWIEYRRLQRTLESRCEACEILKIELAKAHNLNHELREELFHKDEPVTETAAPQITRPTALPWSVKRAQLERESRAQANELKQRRSAEIAKTTETPTDALEKEVIEGDTNAVRQSNA